MTYTFPIAPAFPTLHIRRELERLLNDGPVPAPRAGEWQPAVDAREDAEGFTLELAIPGVAPEQVEVLAEDGVLTVKGARDARELTEGEKAVFSEQVRGRFTRRFRLPKSADLQTVSASYALGILTVRVAKVAPAQPRRVPVSVASPTVSGQ
jgi:HSP20 family protein